MAVEKTSARWHPSWRLLAVVVPLAAGLSGCAEVAAPLKPAGEPRPATAAPAPRERAAVQAIGGHSLRAHVSADGRFVAFDSYATNLASADTRGFINVFVHDRQSGTTSIVSASADGVPGSDHSVVPAVTADGRLIVFQSAAANLVPGDTNQLTDVFVHDRVARATSRVSVGAGGVQAIGGPSFAPAVSADGRVVAFASGATNLVSGEANAMRHIFVHDRSTGTTTRVSGGPAGAIGNGNSGYPSISADGRYVAFESEATNLVPEDTNEGADVFVHDRSSGTTTRVSVGSGGAQAAGESGRPRISGDGRYVTFDSEASNLVAGDTNTQIDVFVHDRQSGVTTRVSVATGGGQAAGGASMFPSISADGRVVAFQSDATNLVPGDTNDRRDIFVHDRVTGATSRVSVASGGAQAGRGGAARPHVSADGRVVVFESSAANLVPDDTNDLTDVFVHDRATGLTARASRLSDGTPLVRSSP